MKRIVFLLATVVILAFSACSKEEATPENCVETQVVGTFTNVIGTQQAPGQLAQSDIPDYETKLQLSSISCNIVKVSVGSSLGSFEAECVQAGSKILGESVDKSSTFSYDPTTKQIKVTFTNSAGTVYTLDAKK